MIYQMKSFRLGVAVFVLGMSVSAMGQSQTEINTPTELLKSMIDVLNAHNEERMKNFVEKWAPTSVPVSQRVKRWMDLSEQGGPFKIDSPVKETDKVVEAIVVDRMGTRLAFRLHFKTAPSLAIEGIQIMPSFAVEGIGATSTDWKNLDDLAETLRKKSHSPAMGIAMIRNGDLKIGVAGVRTVGQKGSVQPADVWSVGSIGKSICSTIIGMLVEKKKLSWNETLRSALPGIPMNKAYEKVTLAEIMRHRGGIPEDPGFRRKEVQRIVGSANSPKAIRAAYIRDILRRTPIAAPNERFAYSNAGYALLSSIAEQATGLPYETLVRNWIFKPLGLKNSIMGHENLPSARPNGHMEDSSGLHPVDQTGPLESMFAGAGGGISMSVGDLAKFGQMHLNGLRGKDGLLKASTIKELHRGIPEGPGGERFYACGWGIDSLKGIETYHGHNGSNGTMRAQIAIFPKSNLVVVGIVNRGGEQEPAPGLEAVLAIAKKYATVR